MKKIYTLRNTLRNNEEYHVRLKEIRRQSHFGRNGINKNKK